MNRTQLAINVRSAIDELLNDTTQVEKTVAVIMSAVDQHVDPPSRTFKCTHCDEVYEEVPLEEIAAVGPPCCPDCGEVMI